MRGSVLAVLALILVGCGGGATQIAIAPPPERATIGTLAGPLCSGNHCTCRDETLAGDGGAGVPSDGRKRFEIRVGPVSNELWVMVEHDVLYKSPETAESCFYVDLSPGEHPVELRASAANGFSAAIAIRELGSATHSWYDTFNFSCGSPGVCSFDELDAEKARIAAIPRAVHDKCGSVRIKALHWDTGRSPDELHPSELALGLHLDVETWAPWKSHGDDTCGGPPPTQALPPAGP